MNIDQIFKEIDQLSWEEKVKVYSYLNDKVRKLEHVTTVLNEIKGSGKGIWGMDAQEYINQERTNDRF